MFRRLHFLLPNAQLAQKVVHELQRMGVDNTKIHAYAEHDLPLGSLRPVTPNQAHDRAQKLENILWKGNLILFFLFLAIMLIAIAYGNYLVALACIAVMLVSFAAGNFFASHIPRVHMSEFRDAVSHNELLLMVDVPDEKLNQVEQAIHRHHPAAVEGGTSWTLKNIDV